MYIKYFLGSHQIITNSQWSMRVLAGLDWSFSTWRDGMSRIWWWIGWKRGLASQTTNKAVYEKRIIIEYPTIPRALKQYYNNELPLMFNKTTFFNKGICILHQFSIAYFQRADILPYVGATWYCWLLSIIIYKALSIHAKL